MIDIWIGRKGAATCHAFEKHDEALAFGVATAAKASELGIDWIRIVSPGSIPRYLYDPNDDDRSVKWGT
jgi:hypothetical protein